MLLEQQTNFYTSTGIHVFFKDPMKNPDLDIEELVSKLESTMPLHLLSEVEMIIIGWFDEFDERGINAFYDGGTLYVSNIQDDFMDMYYDLIHESISKQVNVGKKFAPRYFIWLLKRK